MLLCSRQITHLSIQCLFGLYDKSDQLHRQVDSANFVGRTPRYILHLYVIVSDIKHKIWTDLWYEGAYNFMQHLLCFLYVLNTYHIFVSKLRSHIQMLYQTYLVAYLIGRVNNNIPNCGIEGMIRSSTSHTNKLLLIIPFCQITSPSTLRCSSFI